MIFRVTVIILTSIFLISCKTTIVNNTHKVLPSKYVSDTIYTTKWLFKNSYYSKGYELSEVDLKIKMSEMPACAAMLNRAERRIAASFVADIAALVPLFLVFEPNLEIIGFTSFLAIETTSWILFHNANKTINDAIKLHNRNLIENNLTE